jgi:hypothetical protein
MYTAIRLINSDYFNGPWAFGQISDVMADLGYDLTGTCESPVQYEFLYSLDLPEELTQDEIRREFEELLPEFTVEVLRYDIEE